MNKYRDQLEGTSQLLRIRRLRRIVYAFLFVLAVVLSGASMAVEGASLKPAFFPINGVATIVVLLAFFGVLAGIAFRTLEIRYAKRDSQRFLIIKASIRRAWGVMVLAAILGVVLLLPFAARAIDNTLHEVRSQPIGPRTSASFSFVGTDALGLTRFVSGAFDVRGIAVWSATLYMNSSYPTITAGWSALHKDLVPLKQPAYVEYTIVVQNADTVPIQATLTLDHELAPEFTLIVPVMFLAFAIVEGLWIAYARPLHAKYQGSSIYSVRYEQAADSGERTFAEYFQGPRAPARGGPTSTPVAV